jgi:hypothetical protein
MSVLLIYEDSKKNFGSNIGMERLPAKRAVFLVSKI